MANIQTIHLTHLPSDLAVHIVFYQDLKNAAFLRQQLLDGNSEFEYALIDASVIVSAMHVLAAVFRASTDYVNKRLKSRNVHSEIVFSLSPNNNIAESFRRFGITEATTNLLVIKLSTSSTITQETVKEHVSANFEGKCVPFCDENLRRSTDLPRVRKIYKLNRSVSIRSKRVMAKLDDQKLEDSEDDEVAKKELEISILGLMALRGAS